MGWLAPTFVSDAGAYHHACSPFQQGKLTIAPTLATAPTFWSRPELRLFYTYAHWNRAAADAANGCGDQAVASISNTGVFAGANHGSTIGLHLEGWW